MFTFEAHVLASEMAKSAVASTLPVLHGLKSEHLLPVDKNNLAALKISRGKSRATSKVVVDIRLFNARLAWLATANRIQELEQRKQQKCNLGKA